MIDKSRKILENLWKWKSIIKMHVPYRAKSQIIAQFFHVKIMQNVVYGKIYSWEVMLNVPNFEIDTIYWNLL